jgi:hypothetical protein
MDIERVTDQMPAARQHRPQLTDANDDQETRRFKMTMTMSFHQDTKSMKAIAALEAEVARLQNTIAMLRSNGHPCPDAESQLRQLQARLLRLKAQASPSEPASPAALECGDARSPTSPN